LASSYKRGTLVRYRPTVGSYGGVVSYDRGSPECLYPDDFSRSYGGPRGVGVFLGGWVGKEAGVEDAAVPVWSLPLSFLVPSVSIQGNLAHKK